jgi:hypothetical protein
LPVKAGYFLATFCGKSGDFSIEGPGLTVRQFSFHVLVKRTNLGLNDKKILKMSTEEAGKAPFSLPEIQVNQTGWGPSNIETKFKDMPYQPFSKSDRLGKVQL